MASGNEEENKGNSTEYYVIDIIKATNVPKMDLTSESDAYIIFRVIDKNNNKKGNDIKTLSLSRDNTCDPIWNCRRLFTSNYDEDKLYFELWDKDDITADDYIGNCNIELNTLDLETNKKITPELEINISEKYEKSENNTILFISIWKYNKLQLTKRIFFIRHGESVWNEAQSNDNIIKMFDECDHPLSTNGIKQAINLNNKWKSCINNKEKLNTFDMNEKDLNQFLNAGIILSSPLTRAAQTTLLTLMGHNTLQKKNVILVRDLREIKKIAGQDTLSKYKGNEIVERVFKSIKKYGNDLTEYDKLNEYKFDCNDTYSKWWTTIMDTKYDFSERLNDMMNYLQFENENDIICVGHSLWIKRFFQTYLPNNIRQSKTFSQTKTENCKQLNDFFKSCYDNNEIFSKEKEKEEKEDELNKDLKNEKIM
eukprot:479141_1